MNPLNSTHLQTVYLEVVSQSSLGQHCPDFIGIIFSIAKSCRFDKLPQQNTRVQMKQIYPQYKD